MTDVKTTSFPSTGIAASLLLVLLLTACGGDSPDSMLVSARDYLAKNDPKAAVIQLKNALQKNPDLPEARFLLGQALLRAGDPVGSETELRKALALKHPQEQVAAPLAEAMLAQRQYKKLTDEFSKIELTDPAAKASLQTSLANAFGAQGNAEMGKAALRVAIAADPGFAPALILQARASAAAQEYDAALSTLESVLAKSPGNAEAWKLKGDILLEGKRQSAEAMVAYRKAIGFKPDYVPAHGMVLSMLMQQGKLDEASQALDQLKKYSPNSPQTRYFETLFAFQKKDYKLAKELSQQLMKVGGENYLALQLAGAIELQNKSMLQAEIYLNKALQLVPGLPLARRLLVTTYLRSGQGAKALAALQPLLKIENLDAATNAIAGEVFFLNGDSKKAEQYFIKASTQDPKNTRARTALALTHLASGREDTGFGELQDIAASETGTSADMALISAQLRRKDFDKALQAIDNLEKKQPDKPLAASMRGRVLLAKKDMAGARKSFERALTIDPSYFPAVVSLAAMDLVDKKPDDSRKRFEALLAKDPKNGPALLALAELRARAGANKQEVAELISRAVTANPTDRAPRLLLVDFHLRNKDVKLALAAAQSAVTAVPDSPELLDALGRTQQASGDTNQALATFNKVAAMQPQSALPQMRIADVHMALKNKDAAASSLRKALEIKPDLLDAQRGLILLAVDSKNFQEALTHARNVQKQHPKAAVGYQFEGDIAASQNKWDVAADAYRGGLKQGPFPQLAVKLHAALSAGGKQAEVAKFSSAWLKDNPKDVAFRLYLGDVALARKEYPAAEKMYLDVAQIQPNNSIALNNLAWVAGKQNKETAIAYAERAVALAPEQPAYMDTLAMLLSEKNDYSKAIEWQKKAIALQPQNNSLRLNLAKIHIKGGKKDLARKDLDELAKLGDKFPGQAEVASLLKSL